MKPVVLILLHVAMSILPVSIPVLLFVGLLSKAHSAHFSQVSSRHLGCVNVCHLLQAIATSHWTINGMQFSLESSNRSFSGTPASKVATGQENTSGAGELIEAHWANLRDMTQIIAKHPGPNEKESEKS